MSEDVLNQVYATYIEGFGSSRKISEILEELYPNMRNQEKAGMTDYLEEVHKEINDYFYKYDPKCIKDISMLQKDGTAYFRKKYFWMTQENLIHTINMALYYVWHG